MKLYLSLFVMVISFISAEEYKLGQGYKVNDALHIGGYFSTDYFFTNGNNEFELDDVAFLAYGSLTSRLSYFIELEAAPFYTHDFNAKEATTNTTFHYERLYLDYRISEMFNVRLGKQITPIGYWNLEPINVLRDTSSNPIYSRIMYPKLLTGLDIYGYLDEENKINYHLFVQNNKDLDEDYINIKNDYFYGLNLNYETETNFAFGGTLGTYKIKDTEETVKFIQLNAKYDNYPYLVQTEFQYNDIEDTKRNEETYQFAGYIQGKYNFNLKHALIGRYEYIDNDLINQVNNIGIIGYSYRPLYSISIKTEYQINSDSSYNKAIISFSVLF